MLGVRIKATSALMSTHLLSIFILRFILFDRTILAKFEELFFLAKKITDPETRCLSKSHVLQKY